MSTIARRLCVFAASATLAVTSACGSVRDDGPTVIDAGPEETPLQRYLHDARFRRTELEASLVAPSNGYSLLRREHYDTARPGDWSLLPTWNPRATPLVAIGIGWKDALPDEAAPLAIDAAASNGDAESLRAIGEEAFFRYPVQLLDYPNLLESDGGVTSLGLWTDARRGIGGLVRAPLADGTTGLFLTCATCHAQPDESGVLSPGRPNATIFLYDSESRAGTVAVVADGIERPISARPADLRPVRELTFLQIDATVAQRDVISLAIRIETLIITSRHQLLRPPREIALGLALYLWSLDDGAPKAATLTATEERGKTAFATTCARCHAPPSFTGPPVPMGEVGTNRTMGDSSERGTGMYRVPSLHFVSTRGPLMHDASIPTLELLVDPVRVSPDYHEPPLGRPVLGHTYGFELDPATRADLVAYLRTL